MGERRKNIEIELAKAQEWVDFSESAIWQKLKERIEKEVIAPAKDAFWLTDIDGVNNEKLIRHTLSQRAVVRTALNIINIVDAEKHRREQALKELEKIDAKEKTMAGKKANNQS